MFRVIENHRVNTSCGLTPTSWRWGTRTWLWMWSQSSRSMMWCQQIEEYQRSAATELGDLQERVCAVIHRSNQEWPSCQLAGSQSSSAWWGADSAQRVRGILLVLSPETCNHGGRLAPTEVLGSEDGFWSHHEVGLLRSAEAATGTNQEDSVWEAEKISAAPLGQWAACKCRKRFRICSLYGYCCKCEKCFWRSFKQDYLWDYSSISWSLQDSWNCRESSGCSQVPMRRAVASPQPEPTWVYTRLLPWTH